MQLSIAKKTAYDLMKAENLLQKGWTCEFDDSKKNLGCCRYREKKIVLSRYYIALNSDDETLDTIRHEVAHALTPNDHAHGAEWKREAERLGATPVACAADVIAPEAEYIGTCDKCNRKITRHRITHIMDKFACANCVDKFNNGIPDRKYLYTWRNPSKGEIYLNGQWVKDVVGGACEIDTSIAEEFVKNFGATKVIEMKQLGRLPDFSFDEYSFKDTPEGVFKAFLEVKLWREIKGYKVLRTFWRMIDGNGIVIDIWSNMTSEKYETADRRTDMEKQKVGGYYELIVMPNPKGFLRLQSAKMCK